MLDEIRKMMAEVLQISSTDVINTRTALLAEQATEDARYAATSALNHPEGSTTPIEEAYSRAQDRVARIRKQVEKQLPKIMSLMLAMEIAEQRRAEAKLHREQGWSRPASEEDLNLNRAAVNWFPRLRRHGVHPHYLKQHSNETVAIISDLIIWKAKDAKFADADNPWRQVLAIYARRKINKPGKKGRHGGSVPGLPTPDRHNTGSGDYRFDEMVPAAWGVAIRDVGAVEPAAILSPLQAAANRTINPEASAFNGSENPTAAMRATLTRRPPAAKWPLMVLSPRSLPTAPIQAAVTSTGCPVLWRTGLRRSCDLPRSSSSTATSNIGARL